MTWNRGNRKIEVLFFRAAKLSEVRLHSPDYFHVFGHPSPSTFPPLHATTTTTTTKGIHNKPPPASISLAKNCCCPKAPCLHSPQHHHPPHTDIRGSGIYSFSPLPYWDSSRPLSGSCISNPSPKPKQSPPPGTSLLLSCTSPRHQQTVCAPVPSVNPI